MTFYSNALLSERGIVEEMEKMRRVGSRALSSELQYGDAAYLLRKAQEQWSDVNWEIEHARTRTFVVKGEPKGRKS